MSDSSNSNLIIPNYRNSILVILLVLIGFAPLRSHAQKKILFVTSNQDFYGNTKITTSNHFGEIVLPYDIFIKAGYTVDFISPKGGAIPIGYINSSDSIQKKYLYDGWFMDKLEHTKKPTEVITDHYSAIFYSGGGAAMLGVAEDTTIQKIAREIYNKDGVVSTLCNGTAGIAFLKDKNGNSLYKGRKITGYPDKHPTSASKVANEIIAILNTNLKEKKETSVKSDLTQVTAVLFDYLEGTANGQPERLRSAFHQNFNLYTVTQDTLWVRSGEQYIANIKAGQKLNRIGRIVSIDIEKDAAIAKVEIVVPNSRIFTDYFLLLKYEDAWKIVHKSYSWQELPKAEKK